MTRARDEDDAVRARACVRSRRRPSDARWTDSRRWTPTAAFARRRREIESAAAAGGGQRAVVIARGALADGRRVVVVVTRDFRVVCFDDGLRVVETGGTRRRGDGAAEASVVVSSSGAANGDVGLVVVGARLETVATTGRRATRRTVSRTRRERMILEGV